MSNSPSSVDAAVSAESSTSRSTTTAAVGQTQPASASPDPSKDGRGKPHDYAGLDGAIGRAVFFRPQRFTVAELAPMVLSVTVVHQGLPLAVALRDVSQNGVGLRVDELPVAPEVGLVLDLLQLRLGDVAVYEGRARVITRRPEEGGVVLGVELCDGMVQMDELQTVKSMVQWDADRSGPMRTDASPWLVAGHHEFKASVLELRSYLDDVKDHFDILQKELHWDVLPSTGDTLARRAMVDMVKREFLPEFLTRTITLNTLAQQVPVEDVKPLVELSRRQLDHHFMLGPAMHRARVKPLGYPGDYGVMNHMYRANFEGSSLYASAINYACLHTPASQAVRNRKDLSHRSLSELVKRGAAGGGPVKILLVASGPAQEVYELLDQAEELESDMEILLFDQDAGALAYAHARLQRLVERRWPGRVRLVYLHESIKRLLVDANLFAQFMPFDAIICSGLYDYLKKHTAVRLSHNLFSLLREGGFLNIGNMMQDSPSRWLLEYHMDWWLLYRTLDEMREFARLADGSARISIKTEPTGVNPVVVMHRD